LKKLFLIMLLFGLSFDVTQSQTIVAPSKLEAEPENLTYIKLRWDDNSNNEEGFIIERSLTKDTSSIWEPLASVNQNIRTFYDYWVTNQVTYYYRVYAFAGALRSEYSNIAFATAIIDTVNIPKAPSNLIVLNTTPTSITIGWNDNSSNEQGFIIARRRSDELLFRYIDTVSADILTYQEVGLTPDNLYFYKVCAFNAFGLSDFTNTVSALTVKNTGIFLQETYTADKYMLHYNYPNPFNPETNIKFSLPENTYITLKIFNSAGMEIENVFSGNFSRGTYSYIWNASKYSSGVYFYALETDNFREVKKMILLK